MTNPSEVVRSFYGIHAEEEALSHANGATVIVFDGSHVGSHSDFVAAANAMLPLDPLLGNGLRWDAFCDSLWSGVDALKEPRLAVVWRRADVLLSFAPAVFEEAIRCFREVAEHAQDPASGIDIPTTLTLLLIHHDEAP